MNILYCGDENIEAGLVISILSLLKNTKDKLNIYVLTMDFEYKDREFNGIASSTIKYLDKIVKKKNVDNFVKRIDITKLYNKEVPAKNIETRFTPYCMLRLFADEIEELPDKILYLDTDVVCRMDFSDMYNQDITEYELAGVLDNYGKWFFRNNILKLDYINSGVLLLNISKIKETKLFRKCRERCSSKEMFMPDQSAINKIAISKKIMPRKYNEQKKLHNNTVFQHFTTSFRFLPWFHTVTVKPWQIDRMHNELKLNEYDDILDEYTSIIEDIKLNREEV